jgi:hypothetical protein
MLVWLCKGMTWSSSWWHNLSRRHHTVQNTVYHENLFRCGTIIHQEPQQYSNYLWVGRRGQSLSPGRVKNVIFSTSFRPVLRPTQPPIQWVPEDLFMGVKQPGSDAHHLPPSSSKVKEMWIYTSTPPYAFMV